MKDSSLLWAALITGMIGLVALFFLTSISELEASTLSQAKAMDDYEEVLVEGTITGVYSKENFTLIYITQLEEVKAVAFQKINVSEGQLIQVKGTVQEYEGEKELVAERIRVIG